MTENFELECRTKVGSWKPLRGSDTGGQTGRRRGIRKRGNNLNVVRLRVFCMILVWFNFACSLLETGRCVSVGIATVNCNNLRSRGARLSHSSGISFVSEVSGSPGRRLR